MRLQLPHLMLPRAVLISVAAGLSALSCATSRSAAARADLQRGRRVEQPARAATKPVPQSGNPLWLISLAELSQTRERPIFSPSRRPPALPVITYVTPVAHVTPKVVERPPVSLVGTVASATEGIAILMPRGTRDVIRLRLGEDYQGWMLRSIDGRKAILERNGKTVMVELPPPSATAVAMTAAQPLPSSSPDRSTVQQSFAARRRKALLEFPSPNVAAKRTSTQSFSSLSPDRSTVQQSFAARQRR